MIVNYFISLLNLIKVKKDHFQQTHNGEGKMYPKWNFTHNVFKITKLTKTDKVQNLD